MAHYANWFRQPGRMYLYIPSKSDYLGCDFYIEAWAGDCATRDKSHDLRFNDDLETEGGEMSLSCVKLEIGSRSLALYPYSGLGLRLMYYALL